MKEHLSRRDFLKTMGLLSSGAFLAACGAEATEEADVAEKPAEDETVALSLWHGDWGVWNPYFDGIAERAFYAGVRPRVDLDAPPMPWNEYWDKVAISGEAGVGPEILYLNYNSYKRLYEAEAMRVVPETVYSTGDIDNDYWEPAMTPLKEFDGQYYYVPMELGPQGTAYNMSLLEREGFTEPPTNWEEFLEIAKACVKKENDQVVQSGLGMDGPYMFYHDLMASIGGDYPGWQDETPDKLKTDIAYEAMELLADYERKHDILHPAFSIGIGGWWAGAYLYGKQAFVWWISMANDTLEEQTLDKGGAVPTKVIMPKLGAKGFQAGTRANWGFSVTTACPEEKLDAAWNLWKHCCGKDEQVEYVKLTTMAPSRLDVQAMGRDAYPDGPRGDEAILEMEAIVDSGYIYGQPLNEDLWREAFQDTYDDVIGGKTAKQAFEDNWSKFQEGWTGEA
jgi:ABC-type glycerol-3-phosphate transport system substrate-binding protein